MKRLAIALWRALGSIKLTVAVCFLLAADLGLGYLSLRESLEIFAPMSNVGLIEWMQTYGAANPAHAAWFFAMLALLAALSINTFACTTERVVRILAARPVWRELPFRLAPHLMHYAVLIILAGYLCSYLFATSDTGRALRPGESLTLPGGHAELRFQDFSPELLRGTRIDAFDGYVIRPNARITVRTGEDEHAAVLNFNAPIHVDGYGIYLSDFQSRKPGRGMGRNYISLIVRRDPSAIVYQLGMAVFVLGLVLYVFGRNFKKWNAK
jgi:hypothetical protein